MRLTLASVFTLGLQASLLFALIAGFGVMSGTISLWVGLAIVVVINIIVWLIGPKINDIMFSWLYDMEWMTIDELEEISPEAAEVIRKVADENGYEIPKLGFINDSNPTAFTYGSDRWNARVFASEGLFEFLDPDEVAAVYAHEMGHVTNRDFIIMTIASTIVSMLYIAYSRAFRFAARSRKRGALAMYAFAVTAFIFYLIAEFLLYYLSRLREYYADQFAGRWTDPDLLSSALVKISYGIVTSDGDKEMIEATKNLGIMNKKMSNDKGEVYRMCTQIGDYDVLDKVFLFDLKNPWARLRELFSTHPLTGKRIKRLSSQSDDPMFDFDRILRENSVDMGLMYRLFVKDLFVKYLPHLTALVGIVGLGYGLFGGIIGAATASMGVPGLVALVGGTMMARSYYKYNPNRTTEASTVLELMSDVYASPMRGKLGSLKGRLIGRGEAGFSLSPNFKFQDETGLLYLNYRHWLPGLGDLYFGWRKADDLVGRDAEVRGWFLRGATQHLALDGMQVGNRRVSSYTLARAMVVGGLVTLVGLYYLAPL